MLLVIFTTILGFFFKTLHFFLPSSSPASSWQQHKITSQLRNAVFMLWDFCIQIESAVVSLKFLPPISSKRVVGIFSREGQGSYRFLYEALGFQNLLVREVRTTTITNDGWRIFEEELSRCDFAILYHSKSRGRLNITDVTDSLYDKELKLLSEKLGKENVLVVADDLDSTTQEDKERILNSQPLIREKAQGLILFSKNKTSEIETREKIVEIISHIDKTAPPITICKGLSNQGIVNLVPAAYVIQWVNFVMSNIFKLFTLAGQTRILHYDLPAMQK